MRGEETAKENIDTCCAREDTSSSLRNRARELRDQAYNLEKLADQVRGIHGPAEEALWRLINIRS